MLGRTLVKEFSNFCVTPATRQMANLTDFAQTKKLIETVKPDIIIHAAAMTAVDNCETQRELAYNSNVIATKNIAQIAGEKIKTIAISTDYVFDGSKTTPYYEADATNPINYYGYTKLEAEKILAQYCPNHLIARTSWLYGHGGPSFFHTMRRLAKSSNQINVVADQIGCPTTTKALAQYISLCIEKDLRGIVHLSCSGQTSWHGFATEIFNLLNHDIKISPIKTAQYPTPAKRPAYSVLESNTLKKLTIPPMPKWQDALSDFISSETLK